MVVFQKGRTATGHRPQATATGHHIHAPLSGLSLFEVEGTDKVNHENANISNVGVHGRLEFGLHAITPD